ncbi:MAG: polyprenyl synthetase family protein [Gammaproteobacteria bacterium]|jgi:farnesyl diphosphate synthase|nr:geranyl transferase [Gammaproteobacteria bacterium]|tara:strand:+ start:3815 stop:4711 length:897 start_codon:yes stop_codon:yes gene_type:complete
MKTKDVNFLEENLTRINKALFKTLPEKESSRVTEAIHYSVMNGGKRIRPQIILLLCEMLEVEITSDNVDLIAAAGELIHCYSLIHDDLPAMDDDDYRRGQLSCHKQFDEATAILAGDAIQPLSLEVLTSLEDPNLEAKTKLEIINLFARACGPEGMVEGQNRDILAENKVLTEEELDELHYLKTGKLIEACVLCVCLMKKNIDKDLIEKLKTFSNKFGLAFQIRDDILDEIGDEETIGKPVKSDLKNNKSTYPSILGIEESQKKAELLIEEALLILDKLPFNTEKLNALCKLVVNRKN